MRYNHDCANCKPLGIFGKVDLYYCDHGGFMPCILVRYSDEPSDYSSGNPAFNQILDNNMIEAKRRAIKFGYWS